MAELNLRHDERSEWHQQWSMFQDDEVFLFLDWIQPATLEDFRDQEVLEGGCGGGQHTRMMASVARSVTAVDLNTTDLAEEYNRGTKNITFVADDLATMRLGRQFDVVVCIGVIHHTDDPDRTFDNLYAHLKPGGRMVVWTYSAEGNFLVRWGVEPLRKWFFRFLPRSWLRWLSQGVTAVLYLPVHTIYRFSMFKGLPYYEYFINFRKLSFERNTLNVFDKLNAPQTRFTTRATCDRWFSATRFEPDSISIRPYRGVSYSLVGIKRLSNPT
ncbi:MAG: class I SAM-dependent methyltransferase [Magnetococcales bacterium]|nr:class I SAM-dependent methyltransferase [Magnetococcales bacterium]